MRNNISLSFIAFPVADVYVSVFRITLEEPREYLASPRAEDIPTHALYKRVYVVVQFYPWFNFYFLLFLGMVMYDNEYKTKEKKN